eukprot:3934085-Rhodomonas_salina.1
MGVVFGRADDDVFGRFAGVPALVRAGAAPHVVPGGGRGRGGYVVGGVHGRDGAPALLLPLLRAPPPAPPPPLRQASDAARGARCGSGA